MKPEITVEEYIKIREDVAAFLDEKKKNRVSSYDRLPDGKHRRIVFNNANKLYNKSKLLEPSISKDLISLLEDGVSELKSFDHRLKDMESIKRKIISDSKDYDGSYQRAADNITDAIRYTFVLPGDEYVSKVDEYLHKLESMGYVVIDFKNRWGKKYYQGYNVILECPSPYNKEVFEVQFHTPYGYQIKEGSTRDLYQVVRDDDISPEVVELKQKANKLRRIFQKSVPIPEGAIEYNYDSDIYINGMGGSK